MPARRAPCPSCGAPMPRQQLACPACGTLVPSDAVARGEVVTPEAPVAEATQTVGSSDEPGELFEGHARPSWAATPRADAAVSAEAAEDPGADGETLSDPPDLPEERPLQDDLYPYPTMHAPVLAASSAAGNSRAGAYLPPSAIRPAPSPFGAAARTSPSAFAYETGTTGSVATAVWPPRAATGAWAPPAAPLASSPAADPNARDSSARDATARDWHPGRASLFSDLPFDAPADLPGWLVAIGAVGGAIAFVLPWAPQVLGSSSFGDSYFGQWGLGAPSHLAPFLLLLALAMLAILPNALPAWLKTGIAPLLLGGFMLGLLWPYLVGGFGARIGATLEAVAAFLLVAGGVVTIAPRRAHGEEDRQAS